jgi:hypothetical protein
LRPFFERKHCETKTTCHPAESPSVEAANLWRRHRAAEQIRLGLASDPTCRKRGEWGPVARARLVAAPMLEAPSPEP